MPDNKNVEMCTCRVIMYLDVAEIIQRNKTYFTQTCIFLSGIHNAYVWEIALLNACTHTSVGLNYIPVMSLFKDLTFFKSNL